MKDEKPSAWESSIPAVRGTLPGGQPLVRTDPSGDAHAKIVFVGVYPALTRQRRFTVDGVPMNLPVEVEEQSFAPGSKSGAEVVRDGCGALRSFVGFRALVAEHALLPHA